MKKTIAFIIITVQILSLIACAQSGIFDSMSLNETQIKDLYDLGIMIGDENGNLRLDDAITRAEAAKMICIAGNLKPVYDVSKKIFNDISSSHWAYGYASALKEAEILHGDENGNFNPYDNITNEEIVKMIVSLLGYREMAEQLGGYPAGYTATAAGMGITDNMNLVPKTQAVRKTVAIMIHNSLDIPVMVKKAEDNDEGNAVYVILNGKNGIPFSSLRGTRGMKRDTTITNIDRLAQKFSYQYPYKEGDVEKAISLYPHITYLTGIERASDGREYECPAVFDDRHAYEFLSSMVVKDACFIFGNTVFESHIAVYNSKILVPYDIFGFMDCEVSFDEETYVSVISKEDTVLEIMPNLVCMRKNKAQGYWVPLEVCARFVGDTLYVPLEAVLNELGFDVSENGSSFEVSNTNN